MGDYEDLPYIVIERRSGGVAPFLWGALLGAGIALLLTPRTGEQTQEELRQGVQRLRDMATGRLDEARDTVTGAVTRTRDRVQDRIDSVRDVVEERARQAREAIEAGRRAAREARRELERKVADAREGYTAAAEAVAAAQRPRGPAEPADLEVDVDVVVSDLGADETDERPDRA